MITLANRVEELLSKQSFKNTDKEHILALYKDVFGVSLNPSCGSCVSDAWYGLKHWYDNNRLFETSKINLFTSYYVDKNSDRQREIEFCREFNSKSGYFDNIVVIDDKRPTYNDFFELSAKFKDDVNVIANSDIFFDHTILQAKSIKFKQCFALSRWDVEKDGTVKHFKRNDSQDVWIIRGECELRTGNFYLGIAGCDNRIAYELSKKYIVTNPSTTIRPLHLHLTGVSNYNPKDAIPQPYKMVTPC